jgi:hypothetical protein
VNFTVARNLTWLSLREAKEIPHTSDFSTTRRLQCALENTVHNYNQLIAGQEIMLLTPSIS